MPFVNVKIVKQVIADDPARKKAEIGTRITKAISEVTGIPEDSVWIVFDEVDHADWRVGLKDVATLREENG